MRLQTIVNAILPQIILVHLLRHLPVGHQHLHFTIIKFGGGGGVGLFCPRMGSLYHKAGTVVLMIVVVVTIMDFASAKIRERMI
jgi:ABC-type phosphate/phosphonate transport system permease subunit